MDSKLSKFVVIVLLSALAFTCYAEDESEPNKPAIEKTTTSENIENRDSGTEYNFEAVRALKAELQAELYKEKSETYKEGIETLKWAIAILITVALAGVGYIGFSKRREYREILQDAWKARDDIRNCEKEARERLHSIDTQVASKLKEIEEKGKALVTELVQVSEKQRETSREEAENERKASELFSMGLRAMNAKEFESASIYFAAIVEIIPDDHAAYGNWGTALSQLSQQKEGAESDELLRQAIERYKKSVEIKPNQYEVYFNWGTTLSDLAKLKEGAESEELFRQSFEKYEKSVEIKPDYQETYYNWGCALCDLAQQKEGTESDELLRQAIEKYKKSVEIKPNDHRAYNNWGNALLELAKKKKDEARSRSFEEAKQMCLKAESIKQGSGAYNLACMSALIDNEKECERWLKIGEEADNLVIREKAMKDPDLESVRDKEWFKQIQWPDKK
jgi:tetratricopeptide (TPR) repeat protein